jgi:Mg-chelatase subunit ChlD
MVSIRKKAFVFGGLFLMVLIILPITLFFAKQKQTGSSNAEKSVLLSYAASVSQNSPALQIPAGSTFSLDVYVDPGDNSVSLVKVAMDYDPSKFQVVGGFIPNTTAFPQVIEGPIGGNGEITATLSIGSNLSNAIKTKTKLGTIELKALDTDPTSPSTISFGSSSQALSVSSNSSYEENVLANATPITIQINKPQVSCGTSPADTMLIIDTSGSMNDQAGSSGTKLSNAKSAATNFVNLLSGQANNRVGLVNFAATAKLDSPLTSIFSNVTSQINSLSANGSTCLQCAIDKTSQEITTDKRATIKNAIIILTDGDANAIEGNNSQVSEATADQAALAAAQNAYKTNGTVIYTIGLGQDVDSTFLKQLALSTGGQYYFSPTTDQLNSIYSQLQQILAGGTISGTVFNDQSSSSFYDPTDPGVPGVTIQLIKSGVTTPLQTISTSSDGTYSMQNVCDGNYSLVQTIPSGWIQILPTGNVGYSLTMTNGIAITNENFGDKQVVMATPTPLPSPTAQPTALPTPVPTAVTSPTQNPNGTALALSVLLDGIGNAGDNTNPTASSLSNKTPAHPTRNVTAQVYDVNNNLVTTATGTIEYSSASGSFVGTVYTAQAVPDGEYTIKVRSDYHLTRLVPGVEHLIPNQVNQVPAVALVAGDANNDNRLDILDYNMLIGCYSDLSPAPSCDATTQLITDFNDDGAVNQFDYNLFLRELATQPGQ